MSLITRVLMRRIDALFNAQTAEEKNDPVIQLRSMAEVIGTYMRPRELSWERDAQDPDIQNATDRILNRVWQVEDLGELIVVRTFDGRRNLLMKNKVFITDDPYLRIEAVRDRLYAQDMPLKQAWDECREIGRDARKAPQQPIPDDGPLLLRNRVPAEDEIVEII